MKNQLRAIGDFGERAAVELRQNGDGRTKGPFGDRVEGNVEEHFRFSGDRRGAGETEQLRRLLAGGIDGSIE